MSQSVSLGIINLSSLLENDWKKWEGKIWFLLQSSFLTNGQSASPSKDIPLFVVVGEFDPLLDESISLVRKWPGKKRLDILPTLTYAFLFCGLFSKDAKK